MDWKFAILWYGPGWLSDEIKWISFRQKTCKSLRFDWSTIGKWVYNNISSLAWGWCNTALGIWACEWHRKCVELFKTLSADTHQSPLKPCFLDANRVPAAFPTTPCISLYPFFPTSCNKLSLIQGHDTMPRPSLCFYCVGCHLPSWSLHATVLLVQHQPVSHFMHVWQ